MIDMKTIILMQVDNAINSFLIYAICALFVTHGRI